MGFLHLVAGLLPEMILIVCLSYPVQLLKGKESVFEEGQSKRTREITSNFRCNMSLTGYRLVVVKEPEYLKPCKRGYCVNFLYKVKQG